MFLREIKNIGEDYNLCEGVIPPHITMTLEQIVRDHKITNPVQYFVMGALVEMFKNGGPTRWPRDLNAYSMTTSAELIDTLKGLTEADHVGMAVWLLNELQRPASFESNPYACHCNPQMGVVEWMRYVLQRQA